jgi:hypothetical protein
MTDKELEQLVSKCLEVANALEQRNRLHQWLGRIFGTTVQGDGAASVRDLCHVVVDQHGLIANLRESLQLIQQRWDRGSHAE